MKRVMYLLIAGTLLTGAAAIYSNVSMKAQAADTPVRAAT